MNDEAELLSRNSKHPIKLEDKTWPTVEHYFQAMQFSNDDYQEKIRTTIDIKHVLKLGKARFKKKRSK